MFRCEKIQQWYKNYPISDFFAMRVGPTENSVYYPIDEELAAEFNDRFGESIPHGLCRKALAYFTTNGFEG